MLQESMSEHTTRIIDRDLLKTLPLPEYGDDADKADYGKLLVIAGSARLPGAAILAARAALRSGCGTVRVATPANVALHIGVVVPELMVLPLPRTEDGTIARNALELLKEQYSVCNAAIIGPGLDENDETTELVRRVIAAAALPLVVDAQAFNALASSKGSAPQYGASAGVRVLTPHLAEMSALTGLDKSGIEADREGTASRFARERQVTIVLKGRETLIAAPDGALYKNTAGTRGLGTAGSGDVLAGVIGGLLAQGMDAPRAAVWGVHLHAVAGEAAGKDLGDDGMMARDVLERLPGALRYLRHQATPVKRDAPAGLRRSSGSST
jgi:ADP-dependent NAD(P)H-hydrate dehydratase